MFSEAENQHIKNEINLYQCRLFVHLAIWKLLQSLLFFSSDYTWGIRSSCNSKCSIRQT